MSEQILTERGRVTVAAEKIASQGEEPILTNPPERRHSAAGEKD
jgi:hypothetical protein